MSHLEVALGDIHLEVIALHRTAGSIVGPWRFLMAEFLAGTFRSMASIKSALSLLRDLTLSLRSLSLDQRSYLWLRAVPYPLLSLPAV